MAGVDRLQWFGLIGLVSTGLAAIVNLVTFTLSATWLDIAALVHFRLALNTALIAGTLLCLGWDSACVRLRAGQMDQLDILAFWSLSLGACLALAVGQIVPPAAYAYVQGLALGALFAYPIMHFNIRRAQGQYLGYFLGLNIADKSVRALVILAAVYWQPDHMIGLIFAGLLIWNGGLKISVNRRFSADHRQGLQFLYRPNRFGNGLFLVSSFFMFYLTRSLFFAIPADQAAARVTVDLAMIVGAFLFVPIQSALKISEAEQYRAGEPIFTRAPVQTLRKLIAVEALVIIAASLLITAYAQFILPDQVIIWIALTVLAGFIVTSAMPNMVQIAIHAQDRLWRGELAVFLVVSLLSYLISPWAPHGFILAFGVTGVGYLLFCARLAHRLGLSAFFQQRLVRTAFLFVMQLSFLYALI